MSSIGAGLVIPDLWQQEAVRALQQGKDVVVQAPTGSGKTLHRSKKFLELLDCQAGVTNDCGHRVSIHGIIARHDNTQWPL